MRIAHFRANGKWLLITSALAGAAFAAAPLHAGQPYVTDGVSVSVS